MLENLFLRGYAYEKDGSCYDDGGRGFAARLEQPRRHRTYSQSTKPQLSEYLEYDDVLFFPECLSGLAGSS